MLSTCVGLHSIGWRAWRLDGKEGEMGLGAEVLLVESLPDYGRFDVVTNVCLVLKGVQGRWQSPLDMAVGGCRSLHW